MTDSANMFLVGTRLDPKCRSEQIIVQRLPMRGTLLPEEAINLAAWLVAIADPTRKRFDEMFRQVMGS